MSTLQADTLNNRTGTKTVPVDTVIDGSAKAWVNFNGTGTVAIRAAFNVSSITDNGAGDYTVNFTNAMPDANYCAQVSSSANFTASAGTSSWMFWTVHTLNTTAACRVRSGSYVGSTNTLTFNDIDLNVAVFR